MPLAAPGRPALGQQAIEQAIEGFCGEQTRCAAPAEQMPASTRAARWRMSTSSRRGRTTRCATPSMPICKWQGHASPSSGPPCRTGSTRAFRRPAATISTASSTAAPAALDRGKVWWVPKRLDAGAMHEAAKVLLGRHDFTTFLDPMPGRQPGQDTRSPGCQPAGRSDRSEGLGALVPAQSGALDGRLAETRRRRRLDNCRPEGGARPRDRAAAARWRRPTGFFSCASIIRDELMHAPKSPRA